MPDSKLQKLVLFGVGQTAHALAARVQAEKAGFELWGTTRSASPEILSAAGIKPILLDGNMKVLEDACKDACKDASVLISFPPDGKSDAHFLDTVSGARRIVYISSTAVYGSREGVIDEFTPVDRESFRAATRLDAEALWLRAGAVVLRAPALYGPNSGLHKRLLAGDYRLPGDGSNYVSRIHLDDLAAIILAVFLQDQLSAEAKSRIYVVGDLKPTSHIEVVNWLCERLSLPLPAFAPFSQVNASMTANRRINSARILKELAIELTYPTYVEGFAQCLSESLA